MTLFICATHIYIKKQLWTQGAQPDAGSEYPKVMVNLCPSAVTSVVKWHKILSPVVYNGQFSLEKQ